MKYIVLKKLTFVSVSILISNATLIAAHANQFCTLNSVIAIQDALDAFGPFVDPHLDNVFSPTKKSDEICYESVSGLFQVDHIKRVEQVKRKIINTKREVSDADSVIREIPASRCNQLNPIEATNDPVLSSLKSVCNSTGAIECDGKFVGSASVFKIGNKCVAMTSAHHFFNFYKKDIKTGRVDYIRNGEHLGYNSCNIHSSTNDRIFHTEKKNLKTPNADWVQSCSPIQGNKNPESKVVNFAVPNEAALRSSMIYADDIKQTKDYLIVDLGNSTYCDTEEVINLNPDELTNPPDANCDFITGVSISGVEFIDFNYTKPDSIGKIAATEDTTTSNLVFHDFITFPGASSSMVYCRDKTTGAVRPILMAVAKSPINGSVASPNITNVAAPSTDLLYSPTEVQGWGMGLAPLAEFINK